ncbi:hypothetical protein DFH11DRAFT_1572662 [Phellopilus nigrolimitatus]|nr:hypothetical protein DFH11DRAFT_1572662 [Phellopilus nigrolimitatus]
MSIATSSVADNRAAAATAAACEPASVASRASVSTARSHSSNSSSLRNGLRMKCRKGAAAVAKGKGEKGRHDTTHLQRTHSGGRIHPHLGVAGLSGGTIQQSKVGGRTAAATAAAAAAAASHFGQQLNA